MGALSNKGGRGLRNHEEIGAGASPLVLAHLAREFRGPRLRRSCARLDKTAMLRRLRAVSLFSWSFEQNVRDTQMTTRVTEGARRERAALARECTPHTKRDCSQSKINAAQFSDLRAFVDGKGYYYPLPFQGVFENSLQARTLHALRECLCKSGPVDFP